MMENSFYCFNWQSLQSIKELDGQLKYNSTGDTSEEVCEKFIELNLFSENRWYFKTPPMAELIKEWSPYDFEEEGNIGLGSNRHNSTKQRATLPLHSTLETEWKVYLKSLEQCHLCFKRQNKNENAEVKRLHVFDQQSIQEETLILFVVDYPIAPVQDGRLLPNENGILLSKIAKAMSLTPSEYKISFMLKCMPEDENDQNNLKKMLANCKMNLWKDICYLRPQVIISFGAWSAAGLLGTEERLIDIHGKLFSRDFEISETFSHSCYVCPVSHLDYLQLNPKIKKIVWSDLQKVIKLIHK